MPSRAKSFAPAALLLVAALEVAGATAAAGDMQRYTVSGRFSGSGGSWDYAIVDSFSSRLYLAQGGVTALDLASSKLTPLLVKGKMTHGLASLGNGSVAVDDAATKTITVFNGATGEVLSRIATERENPVNGVHALDALVWEPKSGLLVAINGESGLLLLVDVKSRSVAGTVKIGGKPEYAAVDGNGRVYVNVEDGEGASIVAVDVSTRNVVERMPLRGCDGPTGLAYDHETDLLMSVCENGIAKFIRAHDAREVASLQVAKGADAILFDPVRRRAFVPGSEDGVLTVIAVRSVTEISVIGSVPTQKGSRLGAVDPASGKVYLPAAKFAAPVPPSPYPSVVPGSFSILVVAPGGR